MNKITLCFLSFAFIFGFFAIDTNQANAGYVNGYYRSNGTYVNSYYRSTPSYSSSSYTSYKPSYSSTYSTSPTYSTRSYPSYNSGLKYQSGYYKPSTGSYVQGYYKTYSDGSTLNNRKSVYGW